MTCNITPTLELIPQSRTGRSLTNHMKVHDDSASLFYSLSRYPFEHHFTSSAIPRVNYRPSTLLVNLPPRRLLADLLRA